MKNVQWKTGSRNIQCGAGDAEQGNAQCGASNMIGAVQDRERGRLPTADLESWHFLGASG